MLRPLVLAASLSLATNAQAANYVVSTLADSGAGSLREAVGFANATPGVPDTITFASGLSGTIELTQGQLEIYDETNLQGPGHDQRPEPDGRGSATRPTCRQRRPDADDAPCRREPGDQRGHEQRPGLDRRYRRPR